jgi:hypothetical protein
VVPHRSKSEEGPRRATGNARSELIYIKGKKSFCQTGSEAFTSISAPNFFVRQPPDGMPQIPPEQIGFINFIHRSKSVQPAYATQKI